MYKKITILLAGTGVRKNSTVASGSSSIKILYFDYLKRFINRINEIDGFSIKYRYSDILLKKNPINFILLQSHLLLCRHGFCDVSVTLCNASVTLSK